MKRTRTRNGRQTAGFNQRQSLPWAKSLASVVVLAASLPASAATTLIWDTATTSGIQVSSNVGGGTWDFSSTASWSSSAAGSNPLLAWTDNANTANFQLASTAFATKATISSANGQVGAAGILFAGSIGSSGTWTTTGASLQLGAGGLVSTTDSFLSISAPIVLTASQTWSATKTSAINGTAVVVDSGGISTSSGTTNLVFDGQGLTSPTSTANGNLRVMFEMTGTNTFAGSTTVNKGAALRLGYTTLNTSKLDDNSAMNLGGGTISLSGGSSTTEVVGSTAVTGGANTIIAGPNGGGGTNATTYTNRIQLGNLTHTAGAGGTVDMTSAVNNLAYTSTAASSGIIGGWATVGGSGWATPSGSVTYVGGATTYASLVSTNGTTDNTPSGWTTAENVNVTSTALPAITTKTINALRLGALNAIATISNGATLTVNSGGIMGGTAAGQSIGGGSLTSGMASGELFVYAGNNLANNPLTIGSVIANGAAPTILVKGGVNTLTLNGANTYTGRTYVNAGTLQLDSGGSLANGNITINAGTLSAGTNGAGGTLNYRIVNDVADLISINAISGLDLTNLKFNLALSGSQSLASEYVLADKAVGSSYITGSNFASTILPAGWSIDYDGTTAHPGEIVLLNAVPEPASISMLGIAAGLFLSRRRR